MVGFTNTTLLELNYMYIICACTNLNVLVHVPVKVRSHHRRWHYILLRFCVEDTYWKRFSVAQDVMSVSRVDSFNDAIRHLSLQNLTDEVKLVQNALQKYKLEFKGLELRSRTLYKTHAEHLSPEER